ncbi:phosphate acyltransferase PlsX [Halorhodospira halophila]|uniref:Phosphate acyltransferase n=1 Tax=Halorhodospira halophila (strain DSM 244 / SL1) TaxID=349124 RepID=PLSX_HALHL|nr:phosphate acyltransferase PlsX [Halorhodospira halophila]A1WWE9.1 RecName: Full=Phosphate acyltransferase; AltName: Full=Acyl-ACP phosphotransacylase; AltName: Full=Acyl-[acyl-carrier-protein]--phosphate acyltransferase; AltName: Full=Phosphate-acyl-ACP acyltransferase [Halorhodospira halophila SL1]ABM62011.1 phosphate:acyl-[acyl carrier protein] acyltransferase [Halorhodospira halophila SL1]MBK1728448.1 phosphate acyltransferase [Halorhodospira halophila]
MTSQITLSLDAMGGDHGPSVVVPAALQALERHPHLHLVLVGQEETLREHLQAGNQGDSGRLSIRHCTQVVAMDEPPSHALRSKKDSSMRVALEMVKTGEADGSVSAGNTGALMATARYLLKTLPGIDRPAIMSTIPTLGGATHMLDLGANVDCTGEHLFQFGVMGAVAAEAVHGLERPRVGLLNIGEEEIKGNEQVKHAAELLLESEEIHYAGYIEGDGIYKGEADVVVCDGFVGNVALKTSEGVATLISEYMRMEFRRNLLSKIAGVVALPVLRALRRRIDPRQYNGASLLGLRGVALKSHGSADSFAFGRAIDTAVREAEQGVPDLINARIERLLGAKEGA